MTKLGVVYAQALYGLANQENLTRELAGQLRTLHTAFAAEPAFLRLLAAPTVSKRERCQILEESLSGKLHPYILNFLKILTERGHIRCFGDCCEAFERQYHTDNGILPVCATTAIPLSGKQRSRLENKLEAITGKQVVLTNHIDPSCIGGVRLDYAGKQIDGTVKRRLELLGDQLKNPFLEKSGE